MKKTGFSLIEMLIVVSIIGIIASVVYPSYTRYSQNAHRAKAQADMLDFATAMERHKATRFTYEGAAGTEGAPLDTGTPWIYSSQSPADKSAADKAYSLTIHSITNSGRAYEIRATPYASGPVGSGGMKEGMISVFSDGRKAYDANQDGSYSAGEYCWDC